MGEYMMLSRERLKLAINHKEPDRIPIDLGGFRDSSIATIAYNKLRKKLGISSGFARMYDFIMQLAYPEKEIRDIFHIDTIDAAQAFLKNDDDWREWTLNDGSRCLIPKYLNVETDKDLTVLLKNKDGLILGKKPKNSLYVDIAYCVYGNLQNIPQEINNDDIAKNMWSIPTPEWVANIFNDYGYELFINNIKDLYESTDRAIILHVGGALVRGMDLRGMENFLCDLCLDKKGVNRLFDKFVDEYLTTLDIVIKGVGKYIDILVFGDDMGTQVGPLISLDMFRELFKPRYKKMFDFVHNNSNCNVLFHSCGSVYEFIPDFIDMGIDILNPVQTDTANMDSKVLKKEFGKYITFWGGGCNTKILTFGTPVEIKEDVKRRIDIFSKGGGFVFNPIHNILANVPPENVIALFEAAYKYGFYK
jgi:uroporphyrinogen decarboxylase